MPTQRSKYPWGASPLHRAAVSLRASDRCHCRCPPHLFVLSFRASDRCHWRGNPFPAPAGAETPRLPLRGRCQREALTEGLFAPAPCPVIPRARSARGDPSPHITSSLTHSTPPSPRTAPPPPGDPPRSRPSQAGTASPPSPPAPAKARPAP